MDIFTFGAGVYFLKELFGSKKRNSSLMGGAKRTVSAKKPKETAQQIRSKDTRHGFQEEARIARSLQQTGASAYKVPGSRGPYDVVASLDEETWLIQVKSSRLGTPQGPTTEERRKLIESAHQ